MKSLLYPGCYYHIYTHAVGDSNLFISEENILFFLKRYDYYITPIARTISYCIMPNHLHLLVCIRPEHELAEIEGFNRYKCKEQYISKQFSNLFSSYTQAYNKLYKKRGNLFISNFRRKLVTDVTYLKNLICYIHYNPVHHELVSELTDWKYSSFMSLLSDSGKTKIDKAQVYEWYGNKDKFKEFHFNSTQEYNTLLESYELSDTQ